MSQRDQSPRRGSHGDRGPARMALRKQGSHVRRAHGARTLCLQSARGSHVVSVEPAWGSRVCSALSAWTRPHVCSAELSRHPAQALNVSGRQDLPGLSRAPCLRVSMGQLAWAPALRSECWVWPMVLTAAPAPPVGDGRRPASAPTWPRTSWRVTQCPPLSRVRQGGDPQPTEQYPQSAPARPPPWLRVTTAPRPRGNEEPLPRVPVGRAGRPVTLDETGPPGAGQVLSSPTSPGCTPKRGQAAALQAHPSKGTRAGACPWGP